MNFGNSLAEIVQFLINVIRLKNSNKHSEFNDMDRKFSQGAIVRPESRWTSIRRRGWYAVQLFARISKKTSRTMRLSSRFAAGLFAWIGLTLPTHSESPADPWGNRDFTFKRVGIPSAGSTGRLIQIDPDEEPYHLTPALPQGAQARRARPRGGLDGGSQWFWSGVRADIGAVGDTRMSDALAQLDAAPNPVFENWALLARIVDQYGETILDRTEGTRVSPALAAAVIAVESAGKPTAVSKAGAQGLMQLMPGTAARFNVKKAFEPDQNIGGGVAYLDFLMRAFGDDPILVLAAYNAGEGAVAKNNGVPPYSETRAYVPKVLGAWRIARLHCRVAPDEVTDPCEFTEFFKSSGSG